mgnify:CR=1 FL=1|jgi:KipI family sensor histidine kinase inhibitor|tara:strand:- start:120 stop:848 length:729 start_codon:yes stop_codon:yes gene_type:complete
MTTDFNIEIAGENALIIYFEPSSNQQLISEKIQLAQVLISEKLNTEVIDLIPAYSSILIVFNMVIVDHHQLTSRLQSLLANISNMPNRLGDLKNKIKKNIVNLPIYYSLESGPDLAKVANQANLTIEQVIQLHQSQPYQVFTVGFAPGFAYLGNVNERIATPRLNTPRHKVPKGSVGIADNQTAVYPNDSPGGWNIIGLCPTKMFTLNENPAMPIQVGDTVKFYRISRSEFLALGGILGAVS